MAFAALAALVIGTAFAGTAVNAAYAVIVAALSVAYAGSARKTRQLHAIIDRQAREGAMDSSVASAELLATLDAVPSMIAYWDKDLLHRFANSAYRAHFGGADAESVSGKSVLHVLGEELVGRFRPHVDAALRGDRRIIELSLARPDGSDPRYSVVHFLPDIGAGSEVRGLHVMVQDVEELAASRSKLATALREHHALLHTIHAHSLVSVTDGAGRIIEVNDAFCRISGYAREALVGLTHRVVNSGTQNREFWVNMWRAIAAGVPWRGEICNRAEDGTLYWVDSLIAPFVGPDGRVEKYISIRSDITAAKLTEQRLRASEAFLDRAGRVAGVGGWEIEVRTQRINWSAQTFRIHDLDADGAAPDLAQAMAFYSADSRDRLEGAIAAGTVDGTPWDLELQMTTAAGRAVWVRMVGEVESHEGVAIRLVGAVQEITARKRVEAQLRETDARFKIASDSAGIGVWDFDVVAGRVTWNDWMYRIYGLAHSGYDEPYARWLNSVHPSDRERCAEEIALALRGAQEFASEFRIVRPDGEIRHITAAAKLISAADGAPLRLTGVQFDVTVHRCAEQKMHEASSLLRTVLDSTAEISIIATDPSLMIRVFNAGAERLLGYTSGEVVGCMTPIAMHDANELKACGEELSAELGYTVDDMAVFAKPPLLRRPREWTYIRKGGSRVTVSMVVTPMYAERGELLGYVCVAHDVTRQNRYEESLRTATGKSEQANRAKSEFLANMSHEIRTPLNAIIGLGYLLEQTMLTEDQRQFLAKIQFAGRALLGVINNVLDLSKVEAGEMTLETEKFDLPALVRDLGAMLAPQAVAKGIEFFVDLRDDLPGSVQGDAVRLRQILINLVSNSIKFTETGHVELCVTCSERSADVARVRCEVNDTGIGIEPASLERLFTPFTQADSSTTRRFGGTGLGLSIARRFVELMGGEIGVTSTVGKGSTFWIEIPLRLAGGEVGLSSANQVRGLQVCVADSAGDAPEGVGAMVRALGWIPRIVDTGERLLAVMRGAAPGSSPDVLIVQLHLTGVDAQQLIARLGKEFSSEELPPIILVADRPQLYAECAKFMRTADAILVQPLNSSALFNAVNSAVWKRLDDKERILRFANFDEMHTQWLAGVRVLVVDDSDINLEVAQRILEKQGAIVRVCSEGSTALETVRAHHHDLDAVLMDVQMPVLDGNETTRRIRGELGLTTLPIVALTAGALVAERQRSLAAGMNDFVTKPFDPQVLIRKVRHVVEQARGRPIPIVTHAPAAAETALDLSRMSSIDLSMVRRSFGNDQTLFRSLLPRMLQEFADLGVPPTVLADDAVTRGSLKGRTHKLRGSAGMIGAVHVMQSAGAAERALAEDQPAAVVEAALQQLASRLSTLREEAEVLLATAALNDNNAAQSAASPARLTESDVEDLCDLLDNRNLAAIDKFDSMSRPLRETLQPERFLRLKAAIESLEFQLGADLLREAQRAVS